jgi:peptidoglycan/xylan/chitin deacetylase (PgdA/CDA1 family)
MKRFIFIFLLFSAMALFAQDKPVAPDDSVLVPILIYHAVRPIKSTDTQAILNYVCTPPTLEKELSYLKTHNYHSISFADLVSHFKESKVLPENPIIISFDDSWEDQLTYGVPLLKKYGFTATFFIIVGAVEIEERHQMTWDDIAELVADGMEIGCHSWSHPNLTQIRYISRLNRELVDSKTILESKIGRPVTAFAYPYGQYNDTVISLLKSAGYTCARGTFPGVVHTNQDLFTLTGIIRTESMAYFTNDLGDYINRFEGVVK